MSKAIAIVTGLGIIGLILAAGFGGYQYSESKNAKRVADLNKTIYELGVVVQNETNVAAETKRQLKISNRDRINAIKTTSHANDKVRALQANLDQAVSELETLRADYNFIVLDVDSVNRVYDQARNECHGLPESSASSIIPAKLSEFTGDGIAGVVRYVVGQYCEVATDYNNLYSDAEKLLQQ